MIALGNTNINRICIGATDVSKIYIGDTLVFGGGQPTPTLGYLCFTAEEAGSTIKANLNHSTSIEYSTNGGIVWSDANGVTVTLGNVGTKVWYRGVARNNGSSFNASFEMTGKISASGSIMSLYNNNPEDLTISVPNAFAYLFRDCTSLVSAPILPATTLSMSSYYSMFNGCSGLITAPSLPATNIAPDCYSYMFAGCSSLTTAPELPSTTLQEYCYQYMFYGCSSLTSAPELPAIVSTRYCYASMFRECTSLTSAPILSATTLANYCYSDMFRGCSSLVSAPELPATTLAEGCYKSMFRNCAALTSAPILPATSLKSYCYQDMFYGCTLLNNVTTYIQSWYSPNTNTWLYGVSPTGVFHNLGNASNIPTNDTSGCPSGWTLSNE